ncbi:MULTISPECIES: host cell division inhibitor Icd-like protein [unclassified Serratia (in: enterobacteria)]|uniref:host cell division inhibitor Icd-like protein n=1 Tax=unclassified Serratia (in: enterobacteria) TaxID=2647522 RepID=UPI0030767F97
MIEQKHNTKIYLFAAVLRSDPNALPVKCRITATSEKEARRQLVRDYVLVCAGCVPVNDREVSHA